MPTGWFLGQIRTRPARHWAVHELGWPNYTRCAAHAWKRSATGRDSNVAVDLQIYGPPSSSPARRRAWTNQTEKGRGRRWCAHPGRLGFECEAGEGVEGAWEASATHGLGGDAPCARLRLLLRALVEDEGDVLRHLGEKWRAR